MAKATLFYGIQILCCLLQDLFRLYKGSTKELSRAVRVIPVRALARPLEEVVAIISALLYLW